MRLVVLAAVMAAAGGCSNSETTAKNDAPSAGGSEPVQAPLEEVPPPTPDQPAAQPPVVPDQTAAPAEEPESPTPPKPEDLTADLDEFFGTDDSGEEKSGSPEADPAESDAAPDAPSEMSNLFGDLMAGDQPSDDAGPPEPEVEPLPSEPPVELPSDASLPADLLEPMPVEPANEPASEELAEEPRFEDLFPPIDLPTPEEETPPPPTEEPAAPEDLPSEVEDTAPITAPNIEPDTAPDTQEAPALPMLPELPAELMMDEPPAEVTARDTPIAELPAPSLNESAVDSPAPAETDSGFVEAEPARTAEPTPSFDERRPPKRPSIDIGNTRHLAWLLGEKLSLAAAPRAEGPSWEADALAEMLGVPTPQALAPGTPSEQVGQLLKSAAAVGDALTRKYGVEHAALLEIAVKSNALGTIYAERPELGPAVAAAIENAVDRAGLNKALCEPLNEALRAKQPAPQVREAVFEMHAAMEESLRTP